MFKLGKAVAAKDKPQSLNSTERSDIIEALCINYNAVYYIDFNTDMFAILQAGNRIKNVMGDKYFTESDLVAAAAYSASYAESVVYPEYRQEFLDATNLQNLQTRLRNSEYYTYTYIGDRNGEPCHYMMKAVKVGDDVSRLAIGFMDVEDEHRRDVTMKRMAEEASNIKQTFLSNISQELKSPLNAIMDYSQLLQNAENEDARNEYISGLNQASSQMLLLVQDLLDASSLEYGSDSLKPVVFSISELIAGIDAVALSGKDEYVYGITYTSSIDIADDVVYADKAKINRILSNLIGNSLRYNNENGSVSLSITQQNPPGSRIPIYEIVISDTGIGMDEDFLNSHEPFKRTSDAFSLGVPGMGLGLSVVKKYVDMMNGSMRIESERWKGTTVTLRLPLQVCNH